MDIAFKGTRYEPTEEIIAHATRQLGAIERTLGEGSSTATAHFEFERAVGNQQRGDIWRAELMVTAGGATYRAESTKAKLDHAVTTAARDVAREVRRAKERTKREARKGNTLIKNIVRGFSR